MDKRRYDAALDGTTCLAMSATNRAQRWDIFCNVIDNYGDIGVCWRLARQLAAEYGFAVRLWVDDLAAFGHICPELRPELLLQEILGVEVRQWQANFPDITPGDVVIEAFACRLPERFEQAMAKRTPRPVWINLDYLSAESWVSGCHKLPSPHPSLPLTKYFFFPGFTETTGGLLREGDLISRRKDFVAQPANRERFLAALDIPQPSPDALLVSLFSYGNPALADLLDIWASSNVPIYCLSAPGRQKSDLERFLGQRLHAGKTVRLGNLELAAIPLIPQTEYDKLLWTCDINFVRGEDSFVRAQWAAPPMIWQIYPQEENAHQAKLTAFLDIYCAGMPRHQAGIVRRFFLAWNGENRITRSLWGSWLNALPALRRHAQDWQKGLLKQQDLCRQLVQFANSRL